MMDKRPKKELIDGMRDSLRNFEERYDRSEWDRFQQHRRHKRRNRVPLVLKLAGIAASLFLMVYASVRLLPFFEQTAKEGPSTPTAVPRTPDSPDQPTEPLIDTLDTLKRDSVPKVVALRHGPNPETLVARDAAGAPAPVVGGGVMHQQKTGTIGLLTDSKSHGQLLTTGPPEIACINLTSHLAGDAGRDRLKQASRKPHRPIRLGLPKGRIAWGGPVRFPRITPGVNLTPAFTNKGFSFGGGISALIPLSARIAAEVGVSYVNTKVGRDMAADRTDTTGFLQTVGIRHAVGKVSIPVSLHYAFTETFALSLGLEPFKAVKDQRTDIFRSYRWVVGDGAFPGDSTGRIVGQETRQKRADSLYVGNTYFGFIRLSGRYSPPLLKKHNIVLAPFVAVPVGRLASDRSRWLHGGVSLRMYFGQ